MAAPTRVSVPRTLTSEELGVLRANVPSLQGIPDAQVQANLPAVLQEYAGNVLRGGPVQSNGPGSFSVSVIPNESYTNTIRRLAYDSGGNIESLPFLDRYALEYTMLRWAETNGVQQTSSGETLPRAAEATGTRSAQEVFTLLGEIYPAIERKRETATSAQAVPDNVLVQRIEGLAFKPLTSDDTASISTMGFEGLQGISARRNLETLSRADKFRLELAIDTLARRHGVASPIERVDGEYEEEEIKADLRTILGNPAIRRQFEETRDSLGLPDEDRPIRNVLHQFPVDRARYTEGYGDRVLHGSPDHHWGNDFGPARDENGNALPTQVLSSAAGGVLFAMRNHRAFGNCVALAHADGTYSFYTHLQNFDMLPNLQFTNDIYYDARAENYARTQDAAVTVPQGTPLGMMGNSGPVGTELHLHYEQWLAVNPEELRSGTILAVRRMPMYETTAPETGHRGSEHEELGHGVHVGVPSKDRAATPPLP